jgi:hypothetical protein
MAAVSQTIESYLAGVSRQPDKDKLPGMVDDILNGYPDITFGLTKRPGTEFNIEVGNSSDLDAAYWFIFRYNDFEERYVGVIYNSTVKIFNIATGVEATVSGANQTYLNTTKENFKVLQRRENMIILNTDKTVAMSSTTAPGTLTGEVNTLSDLPAATDLTTGDIYRIKGIDGKADDYVIKWDGTTWGETVLPGELIDFDTSTLPYILTRISTNSFSFGASPWTSRISGISGNQGTSRQPSFTGQKISNLFFYKNRLGFLSEDNVIMSQPLEFFNFWRNSSLTTTEADPIDLTASSLDDVSLFAVQPMIQGLVLFGTREQFVMTTGNTSVLTPSTASISSISQYEINNLVEPVLLKDKIYFTAKANSYSRVMSMLTRGDNNSPLVEDVSKIVTTWLPKDLNRIISSNQNDFIGMFDNTKNYIYFFKSLSSDSQQPTNTWFKWEMAGKVIACFMEQDAVQIAVSANGKVNMLTAYINPNTDSPLVQSNEGVLTNPSLDYMHTPAKSYNATTGLTTLTSSASDPINSEWSPVAIETYTNNSGNGKFFRLTKVTDTTYTIDEDLTNSTIQFGFTFPYSIDLPKIYYRTGESADFTASLTISRMKFAMGKTGAIGFELKPRGSQNFIDVGEIEQSNWYLLDAAPIDDERMFTLPIHQRNDNFDVRLTSDSPYPVSLLSMTWEGQYSPRYYQRS